MSDLEALEAIHEEVVKRFEFESERTRHLDDKASSIMGFAGIITGIFSGFAAFSYKPPTNYIEIVETALLLGTIAALICSLIFGLVAYRIKKFTVVPDPFFLIGVYENKGKERILRDLNDNYAVAIEENMLLNNKKGINIKRSMYALLVATILFPLLMSFMAIT